MSVHDDLKPRKRSCAGDIYNLPSDAMDSVLAKLWVNQIRGLAADCDENRDLIQRVARLAIARYIAQTSLTVSSGRLKAILTSIDSEILGHTRVD